MRKVIYQTLIGDDAFRALMPVVYERGSVPDSPTLPFAVLAFTGVDRRGPGMKVATAQLWCYQERGDYSRIDSALERADVILAAMTNVTVGGQRVSQAQGIDQSPDLYDDVYRANTRYSTYTILGSGL